MLDIANVAIELKRILIVTIRLAPNAIAIQPPISKKNGQ